MSRLTQHIIKKYKEKQEWKKTHLPWLWRAENSIISLITNCDRFLAFIAVAILVLMLLPFSIEFFKSFNLQLLIGIAGVILLAILANPTTRHSLILRQDPAKSIDRIIVTFFLGTIMFVTGAAGFPNFSSTSSYNSPSTSDNTSSFESDYAKERKEKQEKQHRDDVKEENKRQREFYSQLSAPKILYTCKDEDFEHAYGVNFGTYNRLLEQATKDCGESNLQIIKNDK